ncbi:hypothetical protein [Clostridium sp. DJ247]|uniref:hypothetical protein n=1 Tax=Clostridium sp. DJ247 TaxID=2726188 RepID=UPI001626FA59|nr:hypothetical protein [Clostridium sp. DJ247]MBC2582875.1 hypothetical protein [Clostridium sp. DJ247]
MIVINTMEDIKNVKDNNSLPKALMEELEQYFKNIVTNLTGEEIWDSYKLEEYGSIFVMEDTDNPKIMDELGLS